MPKIRLLTWLESTKDHVDFPAAYLSILLLTRPSSNTKKGTTRGLTYLEGHHRDALKLPYLSARIKEAIRLHPSVGLQLPRHPPPEGCHISGYYFPHSARVGVNTAVLHYNEDVFGEDAARFRPERWSERNAAEMDVSLFFNVII
ncbi:hypothetical protein AC579_9968 [Pseudocercospora musae]|uniref:Cytochrome P450 n=1 Tax=Pseudocercospora musae TaxID=113226 RepID=A0A139IM09_9PEZI|nr:hypothetical protein AC579_9968 [Pseudocercospora musae]